MRLALVAAAAAAVVLAATATAGSDPRVCGSVTPGGPSQHAYWCARAAAVSAVRAKVAVMQHVTRWYGSAFCNEAGTVFRWRCDTVVDAKPLHASVAFRATSAGWRTTVTIQPDG